MQKIKLRFVLFSLSVFSLSITSLAKDNIIDAFSLVKQESGHYTFTAKINNEVEATFMLESGIHVMLIDSLFAFNNLEALNLEFIKSSKSQKMNLGGKQYNITHKAKGTVNISNNTSYQGEIFLLSNYKSSREISIPIHKLYNNSTNESCIIKLDLANKSLQVINREKLLIEEHKYDRLKMNFDNYLNMPAIKTDLTILYKNKKRRLTGSFNLDLGNASLIYLLDQNESVQSFLKRNSDIKLQNGYDKKGRLICKVIVAKKCELCNIKFNNSPIAITTVLPNFTTEGVIGIKFFEKTIVLFDFSKSNFYFKN